MFLTLVWSTGAALMATEGDVQQPALRVYVLCVYEHMWQQAIVGVGQHLQNPIAGLAYISEAVGPT